MEIAGLPAEANVVMVTAVPSILPFEALTPNVGTPARYASAYADAKKNLENMTARAGKKAEKAVKIKIE